MQLLKEMLSEKIISIVRGVRSTEIVAAAEALERGGVCFVEVTYRPGDTEACADTLRSIALLREHFAGRMHIGAGTVLSAAQVDDASRAGAEFIISPNTNLSVIGRTKELGLISLPGAYTPTEAQTAWEAGADIVKIFPADALGAAYFGAVKASLSQLRLAAVGGVSADNITDFLAAGACAFGIGSNLISAARVRSGAFDEIAHIAALYTKAIRTHSV